MGPLNYENKLIITKRTTKTEKFEKSITILKMNIIIFKYTGKKTDWFGKHHSFNPELQAYGNGEHFTAT